MSQDGKHTAILFFSRTSSAETRNKTLLDGNENTKLLEALRARSLKTVKESNLPFFEYNEQNQQGDSFGDRITNAFQELFDKGYQNVISVGSDCFDLQVSDLVLSAEKLKAYPLVIGPDQRGGTYLIGVSREAFRRKNFAQLPWCTNALAKSFEDYSSKSKIHWLPSKYDLNTAEDVTFYAEISESLSKLLRVVASETLWSIPLPPSPIKSSDPLTNKKRRGPPSIA